jgi:hypothetical protein
MLIHRREDPALAAVAQQELLSDGRLSLTTVGILMKILNHAPEWAVNAQTFYKMCLDDRGPGAESRRGISRAFRDLEEFGYMRRTRGRKSSGGFHTTLEVTDVPHDFTVAVQGREHGVMPGAGEGIVYVVGPATGSVVKIGTTIHLTKRVNGIQTGHPLLILARWTCPGNVELETYLHRKYEPIRMQGEWFDFGDDDPVAEVAASAEQFYELPPGTLLGPGCEERAVG